MYPISHQANIQLTNSLVPGFWFKPNVFADFSYIDSMTFFCPNHNCYVSCHAPSRCNYECERYNVTLVD